MTQRVSVWVVAVVTVLVVTAAPASAAVASVNTTAADFQAATLDGMEVSGSGTSAVVTGDVGYGESVDFGAVDSRQSGLISEAGYVFNVSAERGSVRADIGDATVTTAYLRYDTNETLIASKSVSQFGTVVFDHTFVPGVDYQLVADAGGNSYETDTYFDQPPLSDGALTVSDTEGNGLPTIFTEIDTGDETISYRGSEHTADADTLFADVQTTGPTTITAQANTGGGWSDVASTTISSDQNVTLDISSSSATRYRTVVESTETGNSRTVTLADEGITFSASAPTLSNLDPPDGDSLSSYDGTISVDVSDADFGLAQGDTISVSASNTDGQIGSSTVSSNDTVSLSYTPLGGPNNITWTATDAYGNSETLTQNFSAPSRLEVRNETNGSQLVDNVEVTLRFYREDNQTVITKTTSNGVISMAGLPADEAFVATAEADGYVSRRIYVNSLLDQERIYLLNESVQTVEIEFEIDDSTGQFSDADTVLTVEKPVTIDGKTEFRTIVGDRVSASGRLPATLEEGARYRLTVSNDGQTRSLGAYTPTVSGIEPLPIGQISVSGDFDKGWLLEHSIDETQQGDVLRLKYVDQAGETTSIETTVVRLNESGAVVETIMPNATETDTQSLVRSQVVTNSSDTFEVRYTIERGGETIADRRRLGQLEGVDVPVPAGWLNLISWVAVFGFGGLVVIKDSRAAAVVMAGSASLFALLGWLIAPTAVLALAAGAAVVYAVAGRGGGGY